MPRQRRSGMIDALWASLPAATGKEIAQRLTEQLGRVVSTMQALHLVSYLRKHATTYGWTVPKVSHKGEGDIFVRVPLTPDGEFRMSERIRHNVRLGAVANLAHVHQRNLNEAVALRAVAEQMERGPRRAVVVDLAEDHDELARRTIRVIRILEEEDPEANSGSQAV